MRVTIELEGDKCTLESDCIMALDCLELCLRSLIAVGFQPSTIDDAVRDKCDMNKAGGEYRTTGTTAGYMAGEE